MHETNRVIGTEQRDKMKKNRRIGSESLSRWRTGHIVFFVQNARTGVSCEIHLNKWKMYYSYLFHLRISRNSALHRIQHTVIIRLLWSAYSRNIVSVCVCVCTTKLRFVFDVFVIGTYTVTYWITHYTIICTYCRNNAPCVCMLARRMSAIFIVLYVCRHLVRVSREANNSSSKKKRKKSVKETKL